MVMLSFPSSPLASPRRTMTGAVLSSDNTSSDLVDVSLDTTNGESSGDDPSFRSMNDMEELLLEAGYSQGDANTSSMFHEASQNSLSKASRPRSSSCCSGSSCSDGSFLTATQREPLANGHDDDASSSSSSHYHGSNNNCAAHDLEAQMAPAPEHVCRRDGCCPSREDDYEDHHHQPIPAHQEETGEPSSDALDHHATIDDDVPVIPLSSLQLLAEKKRTSITEVDAITTTSTSVADEDDQQSVSSAQSLVSVVAELVAYPIKVFAAVMADLNTEMMASLTVPSRAEFVSATILQAEDSHQNGELGLRLDRDVNQATGNDVLAIAEIDPEGHWRESPLCVGDRIISINHTNVSQWQVEAVYDYLKTLTTTDSVTIVAHNPSGEGQWVTVMITKPDPNARTGLGMRSSRPGRIKISRVEGLFSSSLLNPGDQILSINGMGVHGLNSADTANIILQSPKYVTVMAKADSRGAFVIATNGHNKDSVSPLLAPNTADDHGTENNNAMERGEGGGDTPRPRRRILDPSDRCDNCGSCQGPWTALKVLQWTGLIYVSFLMCLGFYVCFANRLSLNMLLGVVVLTLVLMNMVYMTVRNMRRQQQARTDNKSSLRHRCSMFQLSCNVLLLGAFTLLLLMWQNLDYSFITIELVLALVVIVLAPMLIFVNMPSCCTILPDDVDAAEDDNDEEHADEANGNNGGEPEAVASLAESP